MSERRHSMTLALAKQHDPHGARTSKISRGNHAGNSSVVRPGTSWPDTPRKLRNPVLLKKGLPIDRMGVEAGE
jgi:hypothetical protein